ncbi:MAG: hypothetical protein Q8N18_05135 [Opitutaceae bacterium]|nr:hypothetical protein [Opitutaceae bacterium]
MDLRRTDTNAADDSRGRAFGLDGDLYLPVVIASLLSLALGALLGLWLHTGWVVAGVVAVVPIALTLFWALGLKHGHPPGHDRDWLDQKLGGGDFTRSNGAQRGLLDT